jgi:cation diffusion facilitator family transporter
MSTTQALTERRVKTQQVAIIGAAVNLILAAVKLGVGYLAQSAALMADGVHSLSDLLSDGLVWFAARHAGQAPDAQHPYGHGRFETAATLILGVLLALVAIGITWDALERAWRGENNVPGILALYAAAFSIAANEALYWYTVVVAKRIHSTLLLANAWHHRSDAISSIVVLAGVAGSLLGWPYLDAVAALIVGLMVGRIGWNLAWDAINELVDTALDADSVKQAHEVILAIDGVLAVHMLRTRRHGHQATADVHVQVAPYLSVSEGHMISQTVEDRLKAAIPAISDVTVHIDPEDDERAPPCRDLPLRHEVIQALQQRWPTLPEPNHIRLHYLSGQIDIEIHLPLQHFPNTHAAHAYRDNLRAALADAPKFGQLKVLYE